MREFLASVAIVFTLSSMAHAQDYQKGRSAYAAKDYATALKEWKPLAEQGNAEAQYALGLLYRRGQAVLQDYKEALTWFRNAAEQGVSGSQLNLGWMHKGGEGVPQDLVLAHMWFNIASANGTSIGAENRDIVAKKMTAEQIAEAQALARECMASDYQNCGTEFGIARLEEDTPPLQRIDVKKGAPGVAIQKCWNVGALSSVALQVTVKVGFSMLADGKLDTASIRQVSASGGSSDAVSQAYEAARRAIIRCGARGFDLPANKVDQGHEIVMEFNPKQMRVQLN